MTAVSVHEPKVFAGNPFSWRFTAPLFIGSAVNPINSSMIATALVSIAAAMNVSVGKTASLVTVLYLASAIAQPTAGKVAEAVGARRVFTTGMVLVLIGGILGGIAPNLALLLCARVLIGLGTSCAYPTAIMLIRRRAEAAGMHRPPGGVLGGLQIAGVATAAFGLPIGGVLVETVGWRWVFLVNLPVALIALTAALVWIPRDPPPDTRRRAREVVASVDPIGIAGFAGAMSALLAFLFSLPNPNWVLLAATLVTFTALVLWELRAPSPFLDIRLLIRNAALTRTYLRYALSSVCVYAVLYGVAQWLQAARGMSALAAGLMLLPMSVVSALVVAPISRRNLVRGPIVVAGIAGLVGAIGVLLVTSNTGVVWIVAITISFGIATGAAASGNQTALYTQAAADQLGVASGLFRTFGYVGSIGASAITGIVFHTGTDDAGIHRIAAIMVGISIVTIAFAVADRALREKPVQELANGSD